MTFPVTSTSALITPDPGQGFSPVSGTLHHLTQPISSDRVRIETGVSQTDLIPIHYDPMIAKLIVWGSSRNDSLRLLRSKLADYQIVGVKTNINFIKKICMHTDFRDCDLHTGFIENSGISFGDKMQIPSRAILDVTLGFVLSRANILLDSASTSGMLNPFAFGTNLRFNHHPATHLSFIIEDQEVSTDVRNISGRTFFVRISGTNVWNTIKGSLNERNNELELRSEVDGVMRISSLFVAGNEFHLFSD
ncbi:hypothetical protein QAD02_013064, partial [Eretmocerus hayati]